MGLLLMLLCCGIRTLIVTVVPSDKCTLSSSSIYSHCYISQLREDSLENPVHASLQTDVCFQELKRYFVWEQEDKSRAKKSISSFFMLETDLMSYELCSVSQLMETEPGKMVWPIKGFHCSVFKNFLLGGSNVSTLHLLTWSTVYKNCVWTQISYINTKFYRV